MAWFQYDRDLHHERVTKSTLRKIYWFSLTHTMREKCSHAEFFWSECGKIMARKTPNRDIFHAVIFSQIRIESKDSVPMRENMSQRKFVF